MLHNPAVSEAQTGAADWTTPQREKDAHREKHRDGDLCEIQLRQTDINNHATSTMVVDWQKQIC